MFVYNVQLIVCTTYILQRAFTEHNNDIMYMQLQEQIYMKADIHYLAQTAPARTACKHM